MNSSSSKKNVQIIQEKEEQKELVPKRKSKKRKRILEGVGEVRIDSALKRVLNLKGVDNRKYDLCSRRFQREQKAIKRRRLAQIKGDLKSLVQLTFEFKNIGS